MSASERLRALDARAQSDDFNDGYEAELEALNALPLIADVVEAAERTRTNIGLTVYEGTPVSTTSGKLMEKELGAALTALQQHLEGGGE